MNNKPPRYSLRVTGFNREIDRKTLLIEFSKFGRINKCFLEPTGHFARVFFDNKRSAETALAELNNSLLGWQVSLENTSQYNNTDNMARYNDSYEEDFSENYDYCNIHGQPLVVLEADSGDLYVNLKDIRKTGFTVFRRSNFDSVLVDKRQIGKEFELHLLSEAKNYILKNRVACIDEDQILRTIERCKNKLLGENVNNSFGAGRSVVQDSGNITITSSFQQPATETPRATPPEAAYQRPPKSLANNYMPTQVQRSGQKATASRNYDQQGYRGKRENSLQNNVNSNPRTENDLDSSNSSESRGSYRRPKGGFDAANKTQRNPREVRENIPRITFELGNVYEVLTSYKEKENIYWVQDKTYASQFDKIIVEVNELVENLECITPSKGQLVAVEFEGIWNRGRVTNTEPVIVHFLDYGNRSSVDSVKPLPDSLKTVPALAARITLNNNQGGIEEAEELTIKIKKKYDDGTYVVEVLENGNVDKAPARSLSKDPEIPDTLVENEDLPVPNEEQTEAPKSKSYFGIPKPLAEIHDGTKIMVIDVEDNKFLVRTKECALKSRSITEYIRNLDKSALTLTNVKVEQLVLCSKDGFAGLFRGVVVKKDNDLIVTVKYVDFPGEADLSVKSLRNVDEFLNSEPATILITPEHKSLKDLKKEAAEYVSEICQNKMKFTVVLSGNKFDLRSDDGTLLSKILNDLQSPKPIDVKIPAAEPSPPPPKEAEPSAEPPKKVVKAETVPEKKPPSPKKEKVLYDEMDWIEMEPGTYTLMCYCLQDIDDLTFLSSTEEVISHLETVTNVNPTEDNPYEPEPSEMCLVSYKGPDDDDASWYRAVVLSAEEGSYVVNFVDFGNLETVTSKDIRKFPSYLKSVPILGIGCECVGIPKKPEILKRMKELIPDCHAETVVIKRLQGLKYEIELPKVYEKLRAEKLF